MAIEAHKCNGKDCNGLVVFDNAAWIYWNSRL